MIISFHMWNFVKRKKHRITRVANMNIRLQKDLKTPP